MKKLLFSMIVLMSAVIIRANEPVRIAEGVTLEITEDSYIIDFTSPYWEEREAIVESQIGRQVFSQIVYGKDAETIARIYDKGEAELVNLNEMFDHIEGAGVPELPFYSLTLQLPHHADIRVEVSDIEYLDMASGKPSGEMRPYRLKQPYVPCQLYSEAEGLNEIQFDKDAYNTKEPSPLYWASEQGGYLGSNGFTFSFSPLQYIPSEQAVAPVSHARFTISVKGDVSLSEMMNRYMCDDVAVSNDIMGLYDNYTGLPAKSSGVTAISGKYLILTIPKYVSTLSSFVTHKQNLGYNVSIKTFPAGTSCDTIRTYLVWYGKYYGEHHKYILIVGDYSEIPYSDGQLGNEDNPPSDIYYSCLEYYVKSHETNFFPESMVGRWPVTTTAELTTVINKTITFENKTSVTRRISLFSGTGDGESTFASDISGAYNKFITIPSASVVKYDGRSGFDDQTIQNEFNNYDDLVFLYRGHGNFYQLWHPYSAIAADALPSRQAYFSIGLACLLNWPANTAYDDDSHAWYPTFGNRWIRKGDRSCGIYASSTISYTSSNKYLIKYIYNYIPDEAANVTWGQWMGNAAAKYYNALKTSARKKETRKYITLGDPSLYLFGIYTSTHIPRPYQSPKHFDDIQVSENINISIDETIQSIAIYTIAGILLIQQDITQLQEVEEINRSVLSNAPIGTYFVAIKTDKNTYTYKSFKY